jgi:hypothetical protein
MLGGGLRSENPWPQKISSVGTRDISKCGAGLARKMAECQSLGGNCLILEII